ncbi:MAG: sensor histidine kinase [Chloroflexota bacterium]|nr:sensor histidine kinase [Chloroflexota bacterium]
MKRFDTSAAQQETSPIEPGLLPIFRTVVALQLGLSILILIIQTFSRADELPPGIPGFSVGWMALLLLYLLSTGLIRRLGRFYLPLGLAFATLSTLVEYLWEIQTLVGVFGEPRGVMIMSAGGWRLLVGLLAPLVIVASQYSLRTVALFVAIVLVAEATAVGWLLNEHFLLVALLIMHGVVFGLITYIVNRAVSAQRTQRLALAEANRQLADHAETLEQLTISRERNRLARELHDTLAHTLSAVAVQLEAVDSVGEVQPERARELLVKSLANTRSGLTETRRALQSLRASPLDDLGLALAVRNLAESTAKRGGLALNLAIDDVEPLPPEAEQQVYRIAQEALTNVFKHSAAGSLRVALAKSKGQLTLTIEDDGQGFAVETLGANGHYGLRGMQERAELIGATLQIEQATPHGTVVRLHVSKD